MLRNLRATAGVLLIAMLLSLVGAEEQKQVVWSDLNRSTDIIGALGKKLDTYMRISGKAPEQPLMMSNPLQVDEIDGKKLDKPVLIEVKGEKEFKRGKRYELRGYESGAMVSTPPDPKKPDAPQPQTDFHFAVWFEDVTAAH